MMGVYFVVILIPDKKWQLPICWLSFSKFYIVGCSAMQWDIKHADTGLVSSKLHNTPSPPKANP